MKMLQTDSGGEFVSNKLQFFLKKRGITIRYMALYIHEENRYIKQGWRTIIIMKDSILINSDLLNNFWAEAIMIANYMQK